LDFDNWVNFSQAQLARELGMSRQNFARALGHLIKEGVVVVGPKVEGRFTYRLEPSYGWKGSAKGHHLALQARIRAAGLAVHEGGGK
jgi:DNA-binding transcriptional regulator LsrR (DeoR family)